MTKPKVLVIVGPTASGKSALAVKLAKKLDGEIISADSRQVYRGLDVGSGKVTKTEMAGVPHHLLDVADPRRVFSVAKYQKLALKRIGEILKRGHLPIIVGGTGFYIRAVVDGLVLPEVPPKPPLRRQLSKLTSADLFARIRELDPARAKKIDRHNPHRLIRAIEIATALGRVPQLIKNPPPYQFVQIGIKLSPEVLAQKIRQRTAKQIRLGLVEETRKLHRQGLSWKRLESLGLEYRYAAWLLEKKVTKPEFSVQLTQAILQYAKRQLTWWRQDSRIHWLNPEELPANRLDIPSSGLRRI